VRELFLAFLAQHDDAGWLRVVDRLEQSIHPVDRAATRIWFHFFPLSLQRLMERPDALDLARQMTLAGRWRLADQIDRSHAFLYAHRHWPVARRAVIDFVNGPTPPRSLDLGAQVQELAARISGAARVPPAEVLGIAAVALRTLQQVGHDVLGASAERLADGGLYEKLSADQIVAWRAGRGTHGWRRLFGAAPRQSDVTFNERNPAAKFPLIHSQHLTTAAALDTRDYRSAEPRCSEGPIPVHCRACSCGTCWVGVLAGADKLTAMDERERAKLAECGVLEDAEPSGGPAPVIRLACMTQAHGPVSIVIPPWNGLVGRVLTRVRSGTPSSR
jgi:ferredoxin